MTRTQERPASPADWAPLAQGRQPEWYERGATIYTPDDPARDLLLLRAGQVSLFLRSDEGRVLTLRVVEPGQLFGHEALAAPTYDTFAETSGPVSLFRVPAAEAAAAATRDPLLGLRLLEDLGRHRATVSRRLDEVAFKSVPARLASLLLDLAHRHGGPQAASVPRHSHRQLAEMINAYRETVTKVINQFRDARLLEIDRYTITLVNLRRLEELAQG